MRERDSGRAIGALILIGLGVIFLAGQLFNVNVWNIFGGLFRFDWPFWIILPGAALLIIALLGGPSVAGLAVPGAVIGGTGLILLFQERTDRYETWSYMWALYPVFVGLALMFLGSRTGNPGQVSVGRRVLKVGLVLFVIFAAFFELIFTGGFDLIGRYLVPLLLIGAGAYMLLFRRQLGESSVALPKRKNEDGPFPPYGNGKPKNTGPSPEVDPYLQRQIDAALVEDVPDDDPLR